MTANEGIIIVAISFFIAMAFCKAVADKINDK